MNGTIDLFKEVGFSGIFDIAFMSVLIYTLIVGLKRTKSAPVFAGIVVFGIVYLLSRQFNMTLTAAVFQQFFGVILIVIVVIFQEELRRFFEQVAVWSLRERGISKQSMMRMSRKEVSILVKTISDLAKEKTGALIVINGKDNIDRHIHGGFEVNGVFSEPLLKSIFDESSVGHDGAVIIKNNKIGRFGVHLPLSKGYAGLERFGTRHAAALGISELADCLCVVVSEEKGTISIARNGELKRVSEPQKLNIALERFYREILPIVEDRPWYDYFRKNSFEKLLALVMSIVLWFVLVHESRLVYESFVLPVQHTEIDSSNLKIRSIDPKEVKITFSGPRRTFYFFNKEKIKVFLKILKFEEGRKKFNISRSDIVFPADIQLENVEPRQVQIDIFDEEKERLQREKLLLEQQEKEQKEAMQAAEHAQ